MGLGAVHDLGSHLKFSRGDLREAPPKARQGWGRTAHPMQGILEPPPSPTEASEGSLASWQAVLPVWGRP